MPNRFIPIPEYVDGLAEARSPPNDRPLKLPKPTPAELLARWKIQAVASRSARQKPEQADSWLKEVGKKELERETDARRIAEARFRENQRRYYEQHGSDA